MARKNDFIGDLQSEQSRLLPVPAGHFNGRREDHASSRYAYVESAAEPDSTNCQGYGARLRPYAPFIAQLAGQYESADSARARRRERRETANDSYEQSDKLKPMPVPTIKLSV